MMFRLKPSKPFRSAIKLKWKLLLVVLLTGCANQSGIVTSHCLIDQPITIGNDDVLTDETAHQIEVHNEIWERVCD